MSAQGSQPQQPTGYHPASGPHISLAGPSAGGPRRDPGRTWAHVVTLGVALSVLAALLPGEVFGITVDPDEQPLGISPTAQTPVPEGALGALVSAQAIWALTTLAVGAAALRSSILGVLTAALGALGFATHLITALPVHRDLEPLHVWVDDLNPARSAVLLATAALVVVTGVLAALGHRQVRLGRPGSPAGSIAVTIAIVTIVVAHLDRAIRMLDRLELLSGWPLVLEIVRALLTTGLELTAIILVSTASRRRRWLGFWLLALPGLVVLGRFATVAANGDLHYLPGATIAAVAMVVALLGAMIAAIRTPRPPWSAATGTVVPAPAR